MLVYLILIVLIFALSPLRKIEILKKNGKKKLGNQIYLKLIIITFCVVMAVRGDTVGVDTAAYGRLFQKILNASWVEAFGMVMAPVYVIFCKMIGIISKEPQILSIFSSIVINYGLYKYIKDQSSNYTISLFCWISLTLFFFGMNGNRQCMAMILSMNALKYLLNDIRSKKGWILYVLSVGTHATALFLLPGIVITKFLKKGNNFDKILLPSIVACTISMLLLPLVSIFTRYFSKYDMYVNGDNQYSIFNGTGNGRIIILYFFLLFICLIFYLNKNKNKNTEYSNKLLPILVFGMVFGILHYDTELISRIVLFYISLFITFIPTVILKFKGKDQILIVFLILIPLFIYCMISLLLNQNGIVPYVPFWK